MSSPASPCRQRVITSQTEMTRLSHAELTCSSPRAARVQKQLSSSSIGSNSSEKSRRSGDSQISLYQRVLDQISSTWQPPKPQEELSAFPSQGFANCRKRMQDLDDLSKKGEQ
jgi:hypothetical protein